MKRFIALLVILFVSTSYTWAQGCAMCTKTASQMGDAAAKGLNFGILYLAAIPVTFMGTIAYLWYKKSKR